MKLAFSTLGCPDWELREIVAAARNWGYDGVELRAVGGSLDLLGRAEFAPAQLATTRAYFEDAGIEICCVDTSCGFHSADQNERANQVKIALGQINPTVGDFSGNSAKIIDFSNRAKAAGANLILFPELSVCGYPPRDLVERSSFIENNRKAAEDIAAKTRGIAVICGVVIRLLIVPLIAGEASVARTRCPASTRYFVNSPEPQPISNTRPPRARTGSSSFRIPGATASA